MVLGVQREYAWWSDDDVVDVSVAVADWRAVDDLPAIAELPQLPTNLFLAFSAVTSCAFLAVLVKLSQNEYPKRVGEAVTPVLARNVAPGLFWDRSSRGSRTITFDSSLTEVKLSFVGRVWKGAVCLVDIQSEALFANRIVSTAISSCPTNSIRSHNSIRSVQFANSVRHSATPLTILLAMYRRS
jgi:hypothetical protein